MSHATAASLPPRNRRRGRGNSPTGGGDNRYRHAVSRRSQPLLFDAALPDAVPAWPAWLIPSTLVAVMASISAYHFDALMAALRVVVLG